MKLNTILLILTAILSYPESGSAQRVRGIYKTAQDFKNQNLSYQVNSKEGKIKIRLNDFLGRDFITVLNMNTSFTLKKSEIYGYKSSDGRVYRFVSNKASYLILNPTESLLIYKKAGVPRGKGTVTERDKFYFSKTAASPVKDLNFNNLKQAFPESHSFHEALDASFGKNDDLHMYDSFHQTYKLNWIVSRYNF